MISKSIKIALLFLLVSTKVYAKSDELCISEAIYHEAKGESLEGQVAVGNIVLNRIKRTGRSACEIIYAKHQFSWTAHKKLAKVPEKFMDLGRRILQKHYSDNTNGALYFCNKSIMKRFQKSNHLSVSTIIGNHVFFHGSFG
jgi:N-acetylmuramoyl-L-alanine amidase